jgi:hypothetical protein
MTADQYEIEINSTIVSKSFIITFGMGQRFAFGQQGTHVIIDADNDDEARQIIMDLIGSHWCASYPLTEQTQSDIIDKWDSREITLEKIKEEIDELSMEEWKIQNNYRGF